MELALTTIDSLFEQAENNRNNPIIKESLERLESYIALGLTKGIEQAKRGVLSAIINSNGLRLIETYSNWERHWESNYKDYRIANIEIDGSSKPLPGTNLWRYQTICDFVENKNSTAIPLEVLKRITNEIKNKLGVFYQRDIDPILVYPLDVKKHYYIKYHEGFLSTTEEKIHVDLPGFGSVFVALRQWD